MNAYTFRYKLYRLSKRLALGPLGGKALGTNVCRTLEEGRACPAIEKHIAYSRRIAPACILSYPFSDCFPSEFPRDAAFDAKVIYRLCDVVASPETGLVWLPGGPILQESAGSLPRLFNGRIKETLRRPVACPVNGPVILFPSFGYYHVLFDVLANVLHALSLVPEATILIPTRRAPYVDGILDFLGIPPSRRFEIGEPMLVQDLVFSPTWVNGGFIPPADLSALRESILPRIVSQSVCPKKIYISRSRSRSRPLANEKEIEEELRRQGFAIVFFEELPFSIQMATMRQAEFIVAPHGAGLANLVAVSAGTRVVEILSRNWFNTCYAKLAVQLGCDYRFVESRSRCQDGSNARVSPPVAIDDLFSALGS